MKHEIKNKTTKQRYFRKSIVYTQNNSNAPFTPWTRQPGHIGSVPEWYCQYYQGWRYHGTTFGHILTKATFYERKSGVVPDSLAKYYQGWRNHGTTLGLGQGIRLEEPDRIGEIHRVAAGCTQSPGQTRVRGQVQLKLRLLAWVSGHPRCTGHRTSPYPLAHLRGLR